MIASIIGENPYNWIVCEGSTDKIYLEKYFEDIKEAKKIRIVPVGGAREIKKIYGHLQASYEGFKSEATGKIILISDTNAQLVDFETSDLSHIICKRIVNTNNSDNYRTILVDVQSNPKAPPTEIEDALNGKLFYEVLKFFKNDFRDLLDFINKEATMPEIPSYFSLDLRPSEKSKLDQFFSIKSGENKLRFAEKYTSLLVGDYATPTWIQELKMMILGEGGK